MIFNPEESAILIDLRGQPVVTASKQPSKAEMIAIYAVRYRINKKAIKRQLLPLAIDALPLQGGQSVWRNGMHIQCGWIAP